MPLFIARALPPVFSFASAAIGELASGGADFFSLAIGELASGADLFSLAIGGLALGADLFSLAIGELAWGADFFSNSRMEAGLTSHLTKDRWWRGF